MSRHLRHLAIALAAVALAATACTATSTTTSVENGSADDNTTQTGATGTSEDDDRADSTDAEPDTDTAAATTPASDPPAPDPAAQLGALVDASMRTLRENDHLEIDYEQDSFVEGAAGRLNVNVRADRADDVALTEVSSSGTNLIPPLEYLVTADDVLFRVKDGFAGAPETWLDVIRSGELAPAVIAQVEPDGHVESAITILETLGAHPTIDPPSTVERGGDEITVWEFALPAGSAWDNLPDQLIALAGARGLGAADLSGAVRATAVFNGNRISEIELDHRELMEQLESGRSSFVEEYRFFYDEFAIEVPAEADIDRSNNAAGTVPPADVELTSEPGDCHLTDELPQEAIDCNLPHQVETYHTLLLPEGPDEPYPGRQVVLDRVSQECIDTYEAAIGVHPSISLIDERVFHPTEESWAFGDREVNCAAYFPDTMDRPLSELDPHLIDGVVSTFALVAGMCITDKDIYDEDSRHDLVDCNEPHSYEAILSLELPDGPWPGDDAMAEQADGLCFGRFEETIGLPYADSIWFLEILRPNDFTWSIGDRLITCLVTVDELVTGTAVGSGE